MKKKTKPMRSTSIDKLKDKIFGEIGTPDRDKYEFNLRMDLLGYAIQMARKHRGLTQGELGEIVGVKKAQISKLEKSAKNTTIETILKVFGALRAKITFNIDLEPRKAKAA